MVFVFAFFFFSSPGCKVIYKDFPSLLSQQGYKFVENSQLLSWLMCYYLIHLNLVQEDQVEACSDHCGIV